MKVESCSTMVSVNKLPCILFSLCVLSIQLSSCTYTQGSTYVNMSMDLYSGGAMPMSTRSKIVQKISQGDVTHKNKREDPHSFDYKNALQLIGTFLAIQKYYEVDRRREGQYRTFFRGFPSPPFIHPKIQKICGQSFYKCVHKMNTISKQNRYMNKLLKQSFQHLPDWADYVKMSKSQNYFFPFDNWMEYFAYKTTASYYMCWYTMQEQPQLKHFMDGKNCLTHLQTVGLGDVTDYRLDDRPFQCARILFCPDPCYGRETNGNVYNVGFTASDHGNPCRRFADKTCTVKAEDNRNLFYMMYNLLNVTCSCEGYGGGFEYDATTQTCIDVDECLESEYTCKHGKVCRNLVGGYACACERGWQFNMELQSCENLYDVARLSLSKSGSRKMLFPKIVLCCVISLNYIIV